MELVELGRLTRLGTSFGRQVKSTWYPLDMYMRGLHGAQVVVIEAGLLESGYLLIIEGVLWW